MTQIRTEIPWKILLYWEQETAQLLNGWCSLKPTSSCPAEVGIENDDVEAALKGDDKIKASYMWKNDVYLVSLVRHTPGRQKAIRSMMKFGKFLKI